MKFSTAWAKVAAQNVTLKVATLILAIISVTQLGVITSLASREPLVIERSCYSRMLPTKNAQPDQNEIKGFLDVALPMRFDSDGYFKEGFLSLQEVGARDKELATIKQRQMNQKIVISDLKIAEKLITITADRLISIGKIKSALPLNLEVTLEQTNRTEANPYGLIIGAINQIEEKEVK